MESKSKLWLKVLGACALLLIGVGFLWGQYQSMQPPERERPQMPGPQADQSSRAERGGRGGGGFEMPSPEERRQMRDEMLAQANVTPDQKAQIETIWQDYEDVEGWEGRREMRDRISEVLTEEQRESMRSSMGSRFAERMARSAQVLSPQEQEKLRKKIEERMAERRARGGRGGPGGGGAFGGSGAGDQTNQNQTGGEKQ